ncbi:MAG TPA: PAS domain S-box protein [Bryobacteraceae bacterium]|nr:PAS domain S-box protein [Bryobacteraceae bacterium]
MANVPNASAERIRALEAENEGLRRKLAALQDADERLQQQKNLLQTIFDHLPLMVNVASEGQIEIINRAWERTLGWTAEDLAAEDTESLIEALYPDPRERERVHSFTREGKAEWMDFSTRTRNGRTIETTWTNIHLEDGRWVGIGQDITERKRAEQMLRESEERFRAIYEHGRMGIAVGDLAGRLLFANPVFERILGYEQGELIGRSFREFTFNGDLCQEELYIREMLEGKRDHYELEKPYHRKDGGIVWVILSATMVRGSDGKPAFGLAMIQDITERRRSEEELRRAQAYLAEAEKLSHIGTWAVNVITQEIVFWSDEHYRIFGFDPERGIPPISAVVDRWDPDDAAPLAAFYEAVAQKRDYRFEFRLILPDGTMRNIVSIGHPVTNEAGELVEFMGVAMDVTEQRLVERELQSSASQLRALASQMERVREEEDTRIARELHDELGSSLTSLKWDLEDLEASLDATSASVDIAALRNRIARMAQSAETNIRAVKRISSELRPPILDDLGICEALEWQAQEFQARTGIHTTCEIAVESTPLNRDQMTAVFRIAQEAFTNILRHAKATRVDIAIRQSCADFELRITDDGLGVTYAQIANPHSLGILGMRERAHLAGGRIEIQSTGGQGTTVAVHIPIAKSEPETDFDQSSAR